MILNNSSQVNGPEDAANFAKIYKFVDRIAYADLEKMNTKALLLRLKRLREVDECFERSECLYDFETIDSFLITAADELRYLITFKNSEEWKLAYKELKEVLADREHVNRGDRKHRQERAKLQKGRRGSI
jgi:hypothetical protein